MGSSDKSKSEKGAQHVVPQFREAKNRVPTRAPPGRLVVDVNATGLNAMHFHEVTPRR